MGPEKFSEIKYSQQELMEELERTFFEVCSGREYKEIKETTSILEAIQHTIPTDIFCIYKNFSKELEKCTYPTSRAYLMICEGKDDEAVKSFREVGVSSQTEYVGLLIDIIDENKEIIDLVGKVLRRTWEKLGVYKNIENFEKERSKSKP